MVFALVASDLQERQAKGLREYGKDLTPGDGTDALREAYEEALDLAVYLRLALLERDGQ